MARNCVFLIVWRGKHAQLCAVGKAWELRLARSTTRRMQSICGASATSGRGKAGYVCVLCGDTCALAPSLDDIHINNIELASKGSLCLPQLLHLVHNMSPCPLSLSLSQYITGRGT